MKKDTQSLLQPGRIGPYLLKNRMVMAPLTRMRSSMPEAVPNELNVEYFLQRIGAGLIVTDATMVSPRGNAYYGAPGIYSQAQVEGWKKVTRAVHRKGGRIFLQLWHSGRQSHPDLQPEGQAPQAPSAIQTKAFALTKDGAKDATMPKAMTRQEIAEVIEQFRQGAKNAKAAGFDGVEIHGANGYLLDSFLQDNANHRTDEYGGTLENRARLMLEVIQAVVDEWGVNRVGLRISPASTFADMQDSDKFGTFAYLIDQVNAHRLAYLHLIEPRVNNFSEVENPLPLGSDRFRPLLRADVPLLVAGGYTQETGNAVLDRGDAQFVAFGRQFIANPDLPQRFALGAPLNKYDRETFYGGDHRGYTDYPALQPSSLEPKETELLAA